MLDDAEAAALLAAASSRTHAVTRCRRSPACRPVPTAQGAADTGGGSPVATLLVAALLIAAAAFGWHRFRGQR